jgi:glycosyltransferase involved in cell wall biosynthesis
MALVSVVMPVFNAERFVRAAVESVLGQTHGDLELIAIDDGSRDASPAILGSMADRRLRILTNERNRGIVESLNRGLAAARGRYVARMDADDEALPERLERQVAFLEGHPEVTMVGSAAVLIDEAGRETGREEHPLTDRAIRRIMFVHNPFCHGSILLRAEALAACGGYDGRFRHNEDYDLWLRIAARHRVANLREPLIRRRRHAGSITARLETELTGYRVRTLTHAIAAYYRNPLYLIHVGRPVLAYGFRRLQELVRR